jgi:hypothetical protein
MTTTCSRHRLIAQFMAALLSDRPSSPNALESPMAISATADPGLIEACGMLPRVCLGVGNHGLFVSDSGGPPSQLRPDGSFLLAAARPTTGESVHAHGEQAPRVPAAIKHKS